MVRRDHLVCQSAGSLPGRLLPVSQLRQVGQITIRWPGVVPLRKSISTTITAATTAIAATTAVAATTAATTAIDVALVSGLGHHLRCDGRLAHHLRVDVGRRVVVT